jgi:hypothetical protein
MKVASFAVGAACFFISTMAFSQSAKTPLPDYLAPFFQGKPFINEVPTPRGKVTVEVTFNADGSAKITGPRGEESGEWSYEAGRHCVTWKTNRWYDNSCGTFAKEADGTVIRTREGTGVASTWRLK